MSQHAHLLSYPCFKLASQLLNDVFRLAEKEGEHKLEVVGGSSGEKIEARTVLKEANAAPSSNPMEASTATDTSPAAKEGDD